MRNVLCKALGAQAYAINPKRCLCPFISTREHSKCKESSAGTVDLNRLSDLSLFISHLKKQHGENPMARIAVKRIQKAVRFQNIGPEMLDEEGTINWDATGEHAEDKRAVIDTSDYFDPPIDESQLGTDAHAEWEVKVRAKFE